MSGGRQAPSQRFLEAISHDFARAHLVLSEGEPEESRESLLISANTPAEVPFNVGVRLGVEVRTEEIEEEALATRIDEAYRDSRAGVVRQIAQEREASEPRPVAELLAESQGNLLSTDGKGPVAQLVDSLMFEAVRRRASDLHLQPAEAHTLVRCRVDGLLQTMHELPRDVGQVAISRVKVLADLDIAERRVAQDGRAQVRVGKHGVDLRVSTFPTRHGERTVLRLLRREQQYSDLGELGLPSELHDHVVGRTLAGMTLVTGPTGAGKTTSLYAVLRALAQPGLNLMTIEDPIEYELSGDGIDVSQAQVNERKGTTFANGLRHLLRQDPDVILVGEIRDGETARMAVQASLTGHRVLSTLHTNDAPGAVARLLDLGVEPFLVGSSLETVVAQRLVRRVHAPCRGEGCEICFGSGYLGRQGVFEVMRISGRIREMVGEGRSAAELRAVAIEEGMIPLLEAGRQLVRAGVTTEQELARAVEAGDL